VAEMTAVERSCRLGCLSALTRLRRGRFDLIEGGLFGSAVCGTSRCFFAKPGRSIDAMAPTRAARVMD